MIRRAGSKTFKIILPSPSPFSDLCPGVCGGFECAQSTARVQTDGGRVVRAARADGQTHTVPIEQEGSAGGNGRNAILGTLQPAPDGETQ